MLTASMMDRERNAIFLPGDFVSVAAAGSAVSIHPKQAEMIFAPSLVIRAPFLWFYYYFLFKGCRQPRSITSATTVGGKMLPICNLFLCSPPRLLVRPPPPLWLSSLSGVVGTGGTRDTVYDVNEPRPVKDSNSAPRLTPLPSAFLTSSTSCLLSSPLLLSSLPSLRRASDVHV